MPVSEPIVAAMTPDHAAGCALAWEALGRKIGSESPPATTQDCPAAIQGRPLALAGIALGLLKD